MQIFLFVVTNCFFFWFPDFYFVGFFYIQEKRDLFFWDEHNRFPVGTRSACPSDSVDIAFCIVGYIKIDYQSYVIHIQSSGSYIGSHENPYLVFFECSQCRHSFPLAHISVEHPNLVSFICQSFADGFSISFGLGEYDDLVLRMTIKQHFHVHQLIIMFYFHIAVMDLVYCHFFSYFDEFVFGDMFLDYFFDVFADGCTKGVGLFYIWHLGSDFSDIADKSHVQHPVHFI